MSFSSVPNKLKPVLKYLVLTEYVECARGIYTVRKNKCIYKSKFSGIKKGEPGSVLSTVSLMSGYHDHHANYFCFICWSFKRSVTIFQVGLNMIVRCPF